MVTTCDAVRMRTTLGDVYAMLDGNTTLYCDVDLEGEELYSLMWYKEADLLMRYSPKAPQHTLPLGGYNGGCPQAAY